MANALYNSARERFLTAQLNWATDPIKVIMVDTALYTFNASHEFLASIPETARVSTPTLMTGKTTAGGAADASDTTFAAVTGPSIEALVLYKEVLNTENAPDAAQSVLVAYIDAATGLPLTPNGGDIIVTWDNGPNKIFRL